MREEKFEELVFCVSKKNGRSDRGNQFQRQHDDGGQSIDGIHSTHSPKLGLDVHFTVAGLSSKFDVDGREMECLEVVPNSIQEKSSVADPGEKENGRPQQPQEYSSTEDGYVDTVVDVIPREGDNKGDAEVDGMEFEEGSGATISCSFGPNLLSSVSYEYNSVEL